eukprot:508911_1
MPTTWQSRTEQYANSRNMCVSEIRFTQRTVNDTFSKGNPIKWTIHMLKTKQILPCEIPLIRVGLLNGHYKTIDNRRLYCFKQSGIKTIPVIVMKTITQEFHCKDQSPNDGVSVTVIHDPKPVSSHTNTVTAFNPTTRKHRTWTVKQIIDQMKQIQNTSKRNKFACRVCGIAMSSMHDKTHHLNGKRHQLKLETIKKQKAKASSNKAKKPKNKQSLQIKHKKRIKHTKSNDPSGTAAAADNACWLRVQSSTTRGDVDHYFWNELTDQTTWNEPQHWKDYELEAADREIEFIKHEYEIQLMKQTNEIKFLETKLDDEKRKCVLLSATNMKLQNQLLEHCGNNKRNGITMKQMSKTISYLRKRLTESEQSTDVILDIGEHETADSVGYCFWICCCFKKRKY